MDYLVTWAVEITATDCVTAAVKTREMQQDPASIAHIYTVSDKNSPSEPVVVDLDNSCCILASSTTFGFADLPSRDPGKSPGTESLPNTSLLTGWSDLRPAVQRFALAMEEQLRANDHKGGWEKDASWDLFDHLEEEVLEVREILTNRQRILQVYEPLSYGQYNTENTPALLWELADVANMAMMIYDNERRHYTALLPPVEETGQDLVSPEQFLARNSTADLVASFHEGDSSGVAISGQVTKISLLGKSAFFDLEDPKGKIQLYLCKDELGEVCQTVTLGDVVGVTGSVFQTRSGNLCVHVKSWTLIARAPE